MIDDVHEADTTTGVDESFGCFETGGGRCGVEEGREIDEGD